MGICRVLIGFRDMTSINGVSNGEELGKQDGDLE